MVAVPAAVTPICVPSGTRRPNASRRLLTVIVDRRSAPSAWIAVTLAVIAAEVAPPRVIGTAPIERVDILHGKELAATFRNYGPADLGRRVRVLWQGAEYRGRGRETLWEGKLRLADNRIERFAPVNFLNPERKVVETAPGTELSFSSVTTGNLAGIDLWLAEPRRGTLQVDSKVVSGSVDLAALDDALTVRAGLDAVGEPCREILDRFFCQDESYKVIGDALDLPPGTIASRISRCLTKLRTELEGRS